MLLIQGLLDYMLPHDAPAATPWREAPWIWLGGIGIVLVFVGIIVLGPITARPVARFLGKPAAMLRGVTGRMARENSARNPKRTSRTAAPVLIGVALVTAFTAFAASLRSEIRDTIGSSFRGDYALSVENQGFGGIPITVTDQIAELPEVKQATGIGFVSVKFGDDARFAVVIDPSTTSGLYDFTMLEGRQDTLSPTGVLISKTVATNKGLGVGSNIPVTLLDGDVVNAKVEGVFDGFAVFAAPGRDRHPAVMLLHGARVIRHPQVWVAYAEKFAAIDGAIKSAEAAIVQQTGVLPNPAGVVINISQL